MTMLTEHYKNKISLVIGCNDQLILTGTLPEISHTQGMTSYLYKNNVRIFDYPKFAEPFKEHIRKHIEQLIQSENIDIEFVRKYNTRKEEIISEKLRERDGLKSDIVHLPSAMTV